MKKIFFILSLFLFVLPVLAADIQGLNKIFKSNFNQLYVPRMCGQNIGRLIKAANDKKIDLSNSYVLKIVGAGFLETSGFYTRGAINERAMLGYFHFVLVADGYVYDFDLDEPLVLKLNDYIRLQFTPPYQPFTVFGINYDPIEQLPYWKVHRMEVATYLKSSPNISWSKSLGDIVNLKNIIKREKVR